MKINKSIIVFAIVVVFLTALTSCENKPSAEIIKLRKADKQLAANLKMYETTWDEIVNKGNLDLINETNFDENITLISSPENIVGIKNFKAYYQNFIDGFTNIKFVIVDVFGEGNKIVKHWNFKGKHTGDFFGIPATGNEVNLDGVTLVKMKEGKINQEQDFFDNLEFMKQLGLIPRQ